MNNLPFSVQQQAVLDTEINTHVFLEGPFKSGKTTVGVARLMSAAAQSDPTHQILVLTPQRSLANPYRNGIRNPNFPPGVLPTLSTLAGLSRQFIRLYWPHNGEKMRLSQIPTCCRPSEHGTPNIPWRQICQHFLAKGYFLENSILIPRGSQSNSRPMNKPRGRLPA